VLFVLNALPSVLERLVPPEDKTASPYAVLNNCNVSEPDFPSFAQNLIA